MTQMGNLPREMRSLFLWGEVYCIGAKPIYLGCARCALQYSVSLLLPCASKIMRFLVPKTSLTIRIIANI